MATEKAASRKTASKAMSTDHGTDTTVTASSDETPGREAKRSKRAGTTKDVPPDQAAGMTSAKKRSPRRMASDDESDSPGIACIYPKRDLRRMLAVLGALDSPDITHTLVQIAAAVGLDKHTVTRMIKQAQEQAGVTIDKVGATYFIRDWGLAIRPEGARATLEAIFLSRRQG